MKPEELQQLRDEFTRLINGDSISANQYMISLLCECLFKIINEHGREQTSTKQEAEAKLILQMVFSKLLYLRKMLEGVEFESRDGGRLSSIIDPVVVASLIRTIYETIAMFNIVYTIPQTNEEKEIVNKMWVVVGLKYRQRLASRLTTPNNVKKRADEAAQINALVNEIEQSTLFKTLSPTGLNVVNNLLKKKDYKVKFNNGNATSLSWDGIMPEMGMSQDKMGEMYTYFSLYAHPSNVAVFQFGELFNKTTEAFIGMANFNASNGIKLVSFFIADYIKLFPSTTRTFESLPMIDQCLINFHGKFLRTDSSTINDVLKNLG